MTEITEPAKQMAADLANAERERSGQVPDWTAEEFAHGSIEIALALLCARTIERDKAEAERDKADAERDKADAARDALLARMQEDMAEIAEQADGARTTGPAWPRAALANICAIAARWRVEADPLAEALTKLDTITGDMTRAEYAALIRAELAKRGIALGAAK